ncbi:zinc-binding dehydrogenase [Streptosporangium sp. NPDC023825]|uniref:zinc-binding dehydrogenase n=1 Tax=Streptosporangium sp. NPDC023825 TaxID=3154909 RepID=UPI00341BD475
MNMRAAVATAFDRPLEIRKVPVPEPAAHQVLVRIEASGLCHTDTTDQVAAIRALGGVDVAIVPAASPRVLEQAHASLRRDGRLVLVSLPSPSPGTTPLPRDNTMSLPIFETVLNGISVIGSIVGTRADLAEVFRLHAAGRTKVIYETRKLDEINVSFDEVLDSGILACLVFEM